MALAMKKGFLTAPAPPKKPKKKKPALPDDAYLPEQTYELADDDGADVDPLVAEIASSDAAHDYSVEYCRAHCNQYNQGAMKLDPYINMSFASDLRAVFFNRKMHGHHDGRGKGGEERTMLLPSGIVLHYLEWGSEAAPPIVMLHDICDSCHCWDDVAQPLADAYRVLAIDLRGHGESTHSPRGDYGIERHVDDVHELVVRLSLNGREWGGKYTRPWALCGKGMGAAVGAAYASRHVGRVAALVAWDYDPEWPKDRMCFWPYQAGHFIGQEPLGALLASHLGLERDAKYLAIQFVNRARHVDESDEKAGCRFRMDPRFFLGDVGPGVCWTQLRAAASSCRVMLMHTQARSWGVRPMPRAHGPSASETRQQHLSLATAARRTLAT